MSLIKKPIANNFSCVSFMLLLPQINLTESLAKGIFVNAFVKSSDLAEVLIDSKREFNDSFIMLNIDYFSNHNKILLSYRA
jgi:hypothetical protein